MAELDVEAREVHASPKVIMLELTGGVDTKSYPKLEKSLKAVHKAGCTRLVLNLSGLRFMNEADKLLKYDRAFKKVGGGIVLYEVPAKLRVMFQTLELDKKLPVRGSLDDAVQTLLAIEAAPPAKEAPAAPEPEPEPEPAPAPKPARRTRAQEATPSPAGGNKLGLLIGIILAAAVAGALIYLR